MKRQRSNDSQHRETDMRKAINATHVGLFDWVDVERGKAGANITWGDPFFASDGSARVRYSWILDAWKGEARESRESKGNSDE